MKVDKRTYKCNKCGLIIDRDLNAALNLAKCQNKTKTIRVRLREINAFRE